MAGESQASDERAGRGSRGVERAWWQLMGLSPSHQPHARRVKNKQDMLPPAVTDDANWLGETFVAIWEAGPMAGSGHQAIRALRQPR